MAETPFQSKDEFFDALFDHMFEDVEPDDDDQTWFEEKVQSFFEKLEPSGQSGQSGSSRRRRSSGNGSSSSGRSAKRPRRKQSGPASGGYGAGWLFGS